MKKKKNEFKRKYYNVETITLVKEQWRVYAYSKTNAYDIIYEPYSDIDEFDHTEFMELIDSSVINTEIIRKRPRHLFQKKKEKEKLK